MNKESIGLRLPKSVEQHFIEMFSEGYTHLNENELCIFSTYCANMKQRVYIDIMPNIDCDGVVRRFSVSVRK